MARAEGEDAPLRVLVADDEEPIRLLCRVNLEAAGIEVVEAADGQEAIERAMAAPPEVAVLDVMMPHLDGWQVASQLREHKPTTEAGLIFLTALSTEEAEARAEQFGGVYLAKAHQPGRAAHDRQTGRKKGCLILSAARHPGRRPEQRGDERSCSRVFAART